MKMQKSSSKPFRVSLLSLLLLVGGSCLMAQSVKSIQVAKLNVCVESLLTDPTNGTNIQLYTCPQNGSPNQAWLFDNASAIRLMQSTDKCIDLENANTTNGTNIRMWDCNGKNGQKWFFDGLVNQLRSGVDPSKCLNPYHGNAYDGVNILLWDCESIYKRTWTIDGITVPVLADTFNRIHFALDQGKCIDVYGARTDNETNIQIYHCHNGNAQYWHFDGNTIRYYADQTKCLDLHNSDTSNGANIQLFECNGTKAQQWMYDSVQRVFRSAVNPYKCLDLSKGDTTDNNNIQLWDCQQGNTNQQFVIEE